jgi:hypothetical protein
MEDTMRDLLSKLDSIVSETELKDKEDLDAKRKALQDLQTDPVASKDPEISKEIIRRKSALEKEAKSKGFTEESDVYEIGDKFGISFSEDFEIGSEIVDILEDGIVIVLDDIAIAILEQNGFSFDEVEISEEKQKGLDGKVCWKGYKRMGTKMKGGKRVDNCVKVGENLSTESGVSESQDDIYTIDNPDLEKDEITGREEPDQIEVEVKFSSYVDEFEIDKVVRVDTGEDITDKILKDRDLHFSLVHDVQQREQGRERDYSEGSSISDDLDEAEYQGRKVPLGKPMKGDVKKSKVYVKNAKGNIVKVNFGDKKMRIKKSNPNRRKSFRARHNCDNPGPRWKARYWSCRAW